VSRPGWRALLWAGAALVAIAVGIAAGPLPWRLNRGGTPAPGPASPQAGKAAPPSLDPIIALSPFGREAEPPAAEPESPETSLSLVLLGVVIATDPKASTAILEGGAGPSRVYSVGKEVAPGATLEAVYRDHVELRVDGQVETLNFPASTASAAAPPPPPVEPAPADPGATGSGIADLVAQYQSEMQDDPQAVLQDLGLVATAEGYEVQADGVGTLLPAGFQTGDVITKVNGQQVGDITRDAAFFNNVVASGHARIDLSRNGQRVVLSFSLR
jgi:general secretion pathway protein C